MKRSLFIFLLVLLAVMPTMAQTGTQTPVAPPPQVATEATVASVDVYRLNVRSAPSTNGIVLTIIEYGETYPILQESDDGEWYLIQIGNGGGWVSAPLVIASWQIRSTQL
jgi:uncharacterized protein YgiM (DUF1202 family)